VNEQRTFADLSGPTAAGQRGIDSAHRHAEADAPGWTEEAAEALRKFARRTGAEFTIEEARADVTADVGEPDELRAWGAVTQMATRRQWIERTGRYRSAVSSHNSPKPVYRAGVKS